MGEESTENAYLALGDVADLPIGRAVVGAAVVVRFPGKPVLGEVADGRGVGLLTPPMNEEFLFINFFYGRQKEYEK